MIKLKGKTGLTGKVFWILKHADGTEERGENHNLVVTEGDDYAINRLLDGATTMMIGMSLGTGFVTAAKGNVWLTTGYAGNYKAFEATYPKVKGTGADAKIIEYECIFAAGEATANGINEVVITNVTSASDGLHPAASAILAYAQLDPVVNKGAADTLTILWQITALGA